MPVGDSQHCPPILALQTSNFVWQRFLCNLIIIDFDLDCNMYNHCADRNQNYYDDCVGQCYHAIDDEDHVFAILILEVMTTIMVMTTMMTVEMMTMTGFGKIPNAFRGSVNRRIP